MEELKIDYYFEDMDACPIKEAFVGVDYPWEALDKKEKIVDFSKNDIRGNVDKTAVIKGNVVVGEDTEIDPYVVIEGPVIIGKNCKIRPFALIRPGTIIGDDAVVGNASEIKNSIVFNGAKIQSHTFVGDSIIGKGTRVGSATIVANRRFDQKNAKVKVGDKLFGIGRDKYGGVIGDYVRLGANCVTAPGVLLGKYTWVYSGASIGGFIEKEKLVKVRQTVEIVDKKKQELSNTDTKGNI